MYEYVLIALGPGPKVFVQHAKNKPQADLLVRMLVEGLSDEQDVGPNIYVAKINESPHEFRWWPDAEPGDDNEWEPC